MYTRPHTTYTYRISLEALGGIEADSKSVYTVSVPAFLLRCLFFFHHGRPETSLKLRKIKKRALTVPSES